MNIAVHQVIKRVRYLFLRVIFVFVKQCFIEILVPICVGHGGDWLRYRRVHGVESGV